MIFRVTETPVDPNEPTETFHIRVNMAERAVESLRMLKGMSKKELLIISTVIGLAAPILTPAVILMSMTLSPETAYRVGRRKYEELVTERNPDQRVEWPSN